MALTATTIIDDPQCLGVAWVDYSKADGAIARLELTNRTTDRTIVGFATYLGSLVQTGAIAPGATFTQTFRGAAARAGDVSELGYRV